ncbi:MAG: 2-hydroxycyclohexanecarboxyl-CoA dehydrogenase [Pseudonocardiales bacterium]|nr:2-hydroxycyclohexanecarboxyl-CoA dehydrogenase [Pseudonocardiales bacterium]MDT4920415.1 2-hydroxycyclohexanecarboxyl-CoA dehydrogenase [Pseudonocardiales bacterium]
MSQQMQDTVAIVTGSGRGIGKAIARAYAQEGAAVVLASRTLARVEEVAEKIRADGGTALPVACDVSDREQIFAAVERAVAEFGSVHVLVNNAQGFGTAAEPATSTVYTGVEDVDVAFVEYSFRTGALASLWGMQAVFPHMKAQGWGKIINFTSTSGLLGTTGNTPYNMTKEAVRALSRTAANEWGQYGINVNVISPTLRTDAFEAWELDRPEFVKKLRESLPMRRLGDPDRDAGPLAVFLATHGSDYLTGQTLMLNGGKVML